MPRPSHRAAWLAGGSVLLNLALGVMLTRQPASTVAGAPGGRATVPATAASGNRANDAAGTTPLWRELETDDLPTLIARLRARGFPAATIREMVRARINARYSSRLAALTAADPNAPYWRMPRSGLALGSAAMEEYTRLQHERAALLRDLFQDPFFGDSAISAETRRRFGDMPAGKIEQVQRIEDDYAEMNAALTAGLHGIVLPEDRRKLALLEREKHADLAAALTSAELADYEMRSAPLTAELARMLGGFEATEAEFRAIYGAQQAMTERFAGIDASAAPAQMSSAGREVAEQIRSALGEERYRDFLRETNPEFQQLTRVAETAQVPAENVLRAFNLRETAVRESARIEQDGTLTPEQKRAALRSVATDIRAELTTLFGPSGPAAVSAASWLPLLDRGYGVSFEAPNAMRSIMSASSALRFWPGAGLRLHAIAPAPAPNPNAPRP